MHNHEEKMARARALAIFKAPYFASAIYGFVFHALPGIGTMLCTPKLILGYDPEWAEEARVEELAADIVHEVHHILRRHFERFRVFADPRRANIAGDLAINPDMKAGGWELATGPKGAIYPASFGLPDGKTMEEYYALLEQQEQKQESEDGDGPPTTGEGGGEQPQPQQEQQPQQQPQQQAQGQDPKPSEQQGAEEGSGRGEGRGGVGRGCCGGIGGQPAHPELEAQLDGTPGLGRDVAEVKGIEKRMAADIQRHVQQFGRGSVPAGLTDWAEIANEEPHVRWQDELAHIMRDTTGRLQSGGDDFSLRRPSKRSLLRGFPRPGLIEHLPEVAIIRDSSGSMGQKQLMDAAREAYGILQALGIDEVWFVDADVGAAMPWRRVGAQFFRELREVRGRGGTDFRPGIESALKLSPAPDILVYITDGDGTTTDMPPPHISVVWCIVPSHYNKAPAKWGHTVIVSDDPKTRKKGVVMPDDD